MAAGSSRLPIGFGYQRQALSEIRSDESENAHGAAFFSSLLGRTAALYLVQRGPTAFPIQLIWLSLVGCGARRLISRSTRRAASMRGSSPNVATSTHLPPPTRPVEGLVR